MEVLLYVLIFSLGYGAGILSWKALEKVGEERKRQEAVHRAAEQRALSRLKRSESAKAAAERRKQGVGSQSPSDAADTAESQMNVDASLYGRKGASDGLPH